MRTTALENRYRVGVLDHDQFDAFDLRHRDAIVVKLGVLRNDNRFTWAQFSYASACIHGPLLRVSASRRRRYAAK
jgi:hypothetical protein